MYPATQTGRPTRRLVAVALAVLMATVTLMAAADSSRAAETHTITVDNGKLTMGFVFMNNTIMPADVPGPFPPIPNAASSGTIDVQVDGNTATVAEDDFKMPLVWIPDPTAGGAPIPMTFGPHGDLNGSWDATTGRLELTGTLRVDVYTGPPNEEGLPICRFDAPNVTWSTDPNAISPGVPFTNGLDGDGALTAYWLDLPDGESVASGACGKPNAVVHDPGAVWLSTAGISSPPAPPTCQQDGLDGLWPDCHEPEFPDPPDEGDKKKPGKIGAFNVTPKKKAVKKGKKVTLKLKVKNTGDKVLKGKVNIKAPKAKVKVRQAIQLNVPGKKAKVYKVVVTVKKTRKARGSAKVVFQSAKQKGKKSVATIRIKR